MMLISKFTITLLALLAVLLNVGCSTISQSPEDSITVSGTAAYRQRIAMPAEAVLTVILEDVSRADTKATVLAESTQTFGDRQVPLAFSLPVPSSKINPDADYNLRARIDVGGQMRFTTTRSNPVLTRGATNKADLLLEAVKPGVAEQSNPAYETRDWRGEFRYLADAASFTDCASGIRRPVALLGDYQTTERAYLNARNIPGAPLLVNFKGRLELRPGVDDAKVEHIVIEKYLSSKSGEACSSAARSDKRSAANLQDTYWKLLELDGKKIPLAPSHKRQIRITLASEGSRVIGFSGCNQFTGTFTQAESELRFSQMVSTRMACVAPYKQIEPKLLKILNQTTAYRIEGERLLLLQGDKVLARFESVYLR